MCKMKFFLASIDAVALAPFLLPTWPRPITTVYIGIYNVGSKSECT